MKNTSICLFEKSLVSSANRSRFKLLTCEPKLKTDVDLNKLAWLAPPHLLLIPPFSPSDPQPPCCLGELSDSSGSTTNSSQPPELRHRACFISHPLNWVVKTCKNNDGIGQGRVLFFFFFFKLPSRSLPFSFPWVPGGLFVDPLKSRDTLQEREDIYGMLTLQRSWISQFDAGVC